MEKKNSFHIITFILLIIGGLNWLLVGLFQWDIGNWFSGQAGIVSRIIYVIVGLAALYEIFAHKAMCQSCCQKSEPKPQAPTGGM